MSGHTILGFDFNLPFDEAIAFFQGKVPVTPDVYRALPSEAKAKAFTIADTARMDIITDLYAAIDTAISAGTPFADFKKAVKSNLATKGWEGMNPWRLETIFRTNIQQAYQTGHYERQKDLSRSRPYWQYVAVMDNRTRPSHAAMNGKIMPADDPFWKTSYPPNGFNCRCTVRALSQSELEREGGELTRNPGPIADPGFAYNPADSMGRTLTDEQFRQLRSDPDRWSPLIHKAFRDYGRPAARDVTAYRQSETELWPRGEEASALYREHLLGTSLTDVLGGSLVMNEAFIRHLTRDGRERYLPLIAEAIRFPYEIWLQAEKEKATNKVVLRKRYVAFLEAGHGQRLILVAECARSQWTAYTFLRSGQAAYLDNVRNGVLIYGK